MNIFNKIVNNDFAQARRLGCKSKSFEERERRWQIMAALDPQGFRTEAVDHSCSDRAIKKRKKRVDYIARCFKFLKTPDKYLNSKQRRT